MIRFKTNQNKQLQLSCFFWEKTCDWWAYMWGWKLPEAVQCNSNKTFNLIILFNSPEILISFLRFNELDFQEIVLLQMSACRIETYELKRKDL
jgi:hypothetical protein